MLQEHDFLIIVLVTRRTRAPSILRYGEFAVFGVKLLLVDCVVSCGCCELALQTTLKSANCPNVNVTLSSPNYHKEIDQHEAGFQT